MQLTAVPLPAGLSIHVRQYTLARLTALTELDLHGNEIADVTPLGGLLALPKLNLAHTMSDESTAVA